VIIGVVAFLAGLATAKLAGKIAQIRKAPAPGVFGLNRPTAGARTIKVLPKGEHPLQFYSLATPNGQKVTILLEELGLKYDAWFIDISKGDQFTSGFVEVNPNSKIPAMIDKKGPNGGPVRLFESGSILLYLAEKTGEFLPRDPDKRVECINWLFMNIGAAPFFGQFGHFHKYAPEKIPYAIERYTMETKRLLHVLDLRLEQQVYLAGDEYTIADIAWFPWVRGLDTGYKGKEVLGLENYKNVQRWFDLINARPATQKGLKINSFDGPRDYHSE